MKKGCALREIWSTRDLFSNLPLTSKRCEPVKHGLHLQYIWGLPISCIWYAFLSLDVTIFIYIYIPKTSRQNASLWWKLGNIFFALSMISQWLTISQWLPGFVVNDDKTCLFKPTHDFVVVVCATFYLSNLWTPLASWLRCFSVFFFRPFLKKTHTKTASEKSPLVLVICGSVGGSWGVVMRCPNFG